jgi:hypothetical protein
MDEKCAHCNRIFIAVSYKHMVDKLSNKQGSADGCDFIWKNRGAIHESSANFLETPSCPNALLLQGAGTVCVKEMLSVLVLISLAANPG